MVETAVGDAIPKHVRVRQAVLNHIARDNLRTGDRVPSEQQLAHQLGVSVITTRRALDDLASLGVLERVRGKGTFVRQVQFREQPLGRIAFLLVNRPAEAERYATLMEGTARHLRDRNYGFDVVATGPSPDGAVTEELSGASGVLMTGEVTPAWPELLRNMSVPFVVLGSYGLRGDVMSVQQAWRKGTEMLMRRFRDLGCRSVGLIVGGRSYHPCADVWESFHELLPEVGLSADAAWAAEVDTEARVEEIRALFGARRSLPDAVLAFGGCFVTALSVLCDLGTALPVVGGISLHPTLKRSLPRVFEVGFDGPLEREGVALLFDAMADTRSRPRTVYIEPAFTPFVDEHATSDRGAADPEVSP